MSSTKPTGGPAFPVLTGLRSPSHDYRAESAPGVSVRDYFAAKAMQGIINMNYPMSAIGYSMRDGRSIMENYAFCAYEMADAMLAARAEVNP